MGNLYGLIVTHFTVKSPSLVTLTSSGRLRYYTNKAPEAFFQTQGSCSEREKTLQSSDQTVGVWVKGDKMPAESNKDKHKYPPPPDTHTSTHTPESSQAVTGCCFSWLSLLTNLPCFLL